MDGQRIHNITAEGLTYLKDDGSVGCIDFVECYERYIAEFMEPENLKRFQEANHLDNERLKQSIQRRKEWKEVAARNAVGEPWGTAPYIEFYTEPRTRFEFASKEEYWEVRSATEQGGWRTHDLS